MEETQATAAAPTAEQAKEQASEIEVTLRNAVFDDFAFRAQPGDLSKIIDSMVTAAQASTAKRKAIADLDKQQADVQCEIAEAEKRITAATLLTSDAMIKREVEGKSALEDKIAALATQRAALAQ